jgi:hypothetical protein
MGWIEPFYLVIDLFPDSRGCLGFVGGDEIYQFIQVGCGPGTLENFHSVTQS